MNLPFETLVLVLLVGLAAGWLARSQSDASRLGPLGEMAAGLVGAFAGAFAAPHLGSPAGSVLGIVLSAVVGAAVVVLGARHLAGVWASQVSASQVSASQVSASQVSASQVSAPAPETKMTAAALRGSVPDASRSGDAGPRDAPQRRPWWMRPS
jgi:uncharacterized membrane protein YeaQ/YmgE (transglycosylase-associated protein family)